MHAISICNPSSEDKILALSELKASADHKLKFIQNILFVFDRIENIVGKGENAGYQQILLFQQCFSKVFYLHRCKKSPLCDIEFNQSIL